jgi:hypothetical protein
MIVQDLIKASMRKLGAVASGELPTPDELADGLSALQSMLRSWAAMQMNVYASVKESFTLIPTQYIYTWGIGGDINSDRPNQVAGAYVQESGGVSHPVDIISEGQYRGITVKNTASRPYALFFHPTYPFAEVYIYPVPVDAEQMFLDSFKPFSESGSIDDVNSTIVFPGYYEEALIYNLAIRLAPEYGKAIPIEVAGIATASYDRMIIKHAAEQVEPTYILIPACAPYGARYSINSDSYH